MLIWNLGEPQSEIMKDNNLKRKERRLLMRTKKNIVTGLAILCVILSVIFLYNGKNSIAFYLLIAGFLISFLRSIIYELLSKLGL